MLRKYNPHLVTEYGHGMYDGDEYHEATMKESEDGKWVSLQTYLDETARLNAIIDRLKVLFTSEQDKVSDLLEYQNEQNQKSN